METLPPPTPSISHQCSSEFSTHEPRGHVWPSFPGLLLSIYRLLDTRHNARGGPHTALPGHTFARCGILRTTHRLFKFRPVGPSTSFTGFFFLCLTGPFHDHLGSHTHTLRSRSFRSQFTFFAFVRANPFVSVLIGNFIQYCLVRSPVPGRPRVPIPPIMIPSVLRGGEGMGLEDARKSCAFFHCFPPPTHTPQKKIILGALCDKHGSPVLGLYSLNPVNDETRPRSGKDHFT